MNASPEKNVTGLGASRRDLQDGICAWISSRFLFSDPTLGTTQFRKYSNMASTQVGLQGPLFAREHIHPATTKVCEAYLFPPDAPSQTSVCYSPDGKFLYTAGTSVIRKFNTASKDEPVTIDTTGDITGIVATVRYPRPPPPHPPPFSHS